MPSNRIIVAPGGSAGAILGSYDIFGTNAGAETVTVYNSTSAVFQGDFARGGDTIKLYDIATDFTVRLAGSSAELFSASDGISVFVPIGTAGVSIRFLTGNNIFDDVRTLKFDGTNVVLGSQVVTTNALSVSSIAVSGLTAVPAIEKVVFQSEDAKAVHADSSVLPVLGWDAGMPPVANYAPASAGVDALFNHHFAPMAFA